MTGICCYSDLSKQQFWNVLPLTSPAAPEHRLVPETHGSHHRHTQLFKWPAFSLRPPSLNSNRAARYHHFLLRTRVQNLCVVRVGINHRGSLLKHRGKKNNLKKIIMQKSWYGVAASGQDVSNLTAVLQRSKKNK